MCRERSGRQRDHVLRNIDAESARWREGIQQRAVFTTKEQYGFPLGDRKPQILDLLFPVEKIPSTPTIERSGQAIQCVSLWLLLWHRCDPVLVAVGDGCSLGTDYLFCEHDRGRVLTYD